MTFKCLAVRCGKKAAQLFGKGMTGHKVTVSMEMSPWDFAKYFNHCCLKVLFDIFLSSLSGKQKLSLAV